MKKITFFLVALFLIYTNNAHAATVSTAKEICRCAYSAPFFNVCNYDPDQCFWECDSTFTTNKDAFAPSENVIINVSQAGSNPPLTMNCVSTLNSGSSATPGGTTATNWSATLTDGQSYSHAAPSAPGSYTQSVSASYQCKPGSPNCENDSQGKQYYIFPNFSEAFVPFSVSSYECNDGIDNTDPEDTLADSADPGCHSDYQASNGASYVPTGASEVNGLPPTVNITPRSAQAFIRQMAQIFIPTIKRSNWS